MSHFLVRFTRYNRKTCESRQSGIWWVNADSFAAAHTLAETRRGGMADADPGSEYRIMTIDGSRDYHGVDCIDGCLLWETRAEFSARVDAEMKP